MSDEQGAIVVVVRIKEIRRDYETKGFFRIGLLPMEVVQGVVIEINQATSVTDFLTRCQGFLFSKEANRLELHDLHLLIHGLTPTRLSCEVAKPSSSGRLELLGSVIFERGTNRVEAAHAFLQVKGSGVGDLTMIKPGWKTSLSELPSGPRKANSSETQANQ